MDNITRLNNGIELFYKKNPNTPRIAFCFNISINNSEEIAGTNALMTRLFLQGTKTRSSEQLAEELEANAIELSCELKSDYVRFRFVCLNEDFLKAVEILSDILNNSTFDEFDKEKEKFRGEITADLDSPRYTVSDSFYRTIFEGHSYGNTSTKILENLDKITKQDVIDAYNSIIINSKKICALVGDIELEKFLPELNKAFGALTNGKDEKNLEELSKLALPKTAETLKPDANQAHLLKGWLVATHNNEEDWASLNLLNVILGASGLSSRLFLELRDKKGLAYVVRSSYEARKLCGVFSIYIATEPKNIQVSLDGFKEEIDKIKSIPVSEKELEDAKNNLFGKWAFTSETNMQQACQCAHYGILGLGFDFNDKIRERIKQLTIQQIQNCANKYFNENFVYAVLKP